LRGRPGLAVLTATVLCTALTLVYLHPVWRVWQDHIAPVPEDSVFNLWVLKWGVHQIRLGAVRYSASLGGLPNAVPIDARPVVAELDDELLGAERGPQSQRALRALVLPRALLRRLDAVVHGVPDDVHELAEQAREAAAIEGHTARVDHDAQVALAEAPG